MVNGRLRDARNNVLAKKNPERYSPTFPMCRRHSQTTTLHLSHMNFPLQLRFKLFALAPQIYVMDATKNEVFYVKQKLFKLRDAINVFSDSKQTQQVATIQANSIIDFSARFQFTDVSGQPIGGIGRQGMRSLWKATYDIFDAAGQAAGTMTEENPFAKIMDALLAEIPVIGIFAGYVFLPRYVLKDAAGTPVLRMKKMGSMVDRRFLIEELVPTTPEQTRRNVLASLMLVLLERHRK